MSSPAAATASTRNEEVEVVNSFPLGGCLPMPSEEQRRLHAHTTDALRNCCQPGPLKPTSTMFTMTPSDVIATVAAHAQHGIILL